MAEDVHHQQGGVTVPDVASAVACLYVGVSLRVVSVSCRLRVLRLLKSGAKSSPEVVALGAA